MFPRFSFNNKVYIRMSNVVFFSQKPKRLPIEVFSSYVFDIRIFQFGHRMLNSILFFLSFFTNHVSHVLFMCSNKEMFRIYAMPDITFVANEFSRFYISNEKLVGGPMSKNCLSRPAPSKHPIFRCFNNTSRPQPTRICFLNFFKKSFNNFHGKLLVCGVSIVQF